eukprot:Hpha_TRINITY_DN27492_c0_g1::TRINITY_DN27492_c0_g1_i1::g.193957::m.193957
MREMFSTPRSRLAAAGVAFGVALLWWFVAVPSVYRSLKRNVFGCDVPVTTAEIDSAVFPHPEELLAASREGRTEQRPRPQPSVQVKLVLLSDTHGLHNNVRVPDGDILIFCGDYSDVQQADRNTTATFDAWLGQLPHRFKFVVLGNHDQPGLKKMRNAQVLTDKMVKVDVRGRSVAIYGSPWQPQYPGWFTYVPRGQIKSFWRQIPSGLDVLVTHSPPYKYGDGEMGFDAGCWELLRAVRRASPRVHVFGHVHNGWPRTGDIPGGSDTIDFVNAAVVDNSIRLVRGPIERVI